MDRHRHTDRHTDRHTGRHTADRQTDRYISKNQFLGSGGLKTWTFDKNGGGEGGGGTFCINLIPSPMRM